VSEKALPPGNEWPSTMTNPIPFPTFYAECFYWLSNPMNSFSADLQAELEDRLRFEALLADLSACFANLPSDRVDQAIENALRCLVEALRADRATLGRLSEDGQDLVVIDGQDLVVTHAFAVPGVETFPLVPSLATAAPFLFRTLLSGQPFVMVRLADLPTEAEKERQLFASRQISSGVVVPLIAGGHVIGGVGCSLAHGEREWSKLAVRGLRLIADVFANALARQHVDQALQASEERFRLAATVASVGLWLWDIPRDDIWASEQARVLYGIGPDEPLNFEQFMACLQVHGLPASG